VPAGDWKALYVSTVPAAHRPQDFLTGCSVREGEDMRIDDAASWRVPDDRRQRYGGGIGC
jgi:hypothetical protein